MCDNIAMISFSWKATQGQGNRECTSLSTKQNKLPVQSELASMNERVIVQITPITLFTLMGEQIERESEIMNCAQSIIHFFIVIF